MAKGNRSSKRLAGEQSRRGDKQPPILSSGVPYKYEPGRKNFKSIYDCYNPVNKKGSLPMSRYNVTISQNVKNSLIDFPTIGNGNVYHGKYGSNSSSKEISSRQIYQNRNVHEISDLIMDTLNRNQKRDSKTDQLIISSKAKKGLKDRVQQFNQYGTKLTYFASKDHSRQKDSLFNMNPFVNRTADSTLNSRQRPSIQKRYKNNSKKARNTRRTDSKINDFSQYKRYSKATLIDHNDLSSLSKRRDTKPFKRFDTHINNRIYTGIMNDDSGSLNLINPKSENSKEGVVSFKNEHQNLYSPNLEQGQVKIKLLNSDSCSKAIGTVKPVVKAKAKHLNMATRISVNKSTRDANLRKKPKKRLVLGKNSFQEYADVQKVNLDRRLIKDVPKNKNETRREIIETDSLSIRMPSLNEKQVKSKNTQLQVHNSMLSKEIDSQS